MERTAVDLDRVKEYNNDVIKAEASGRGAPLFLFDDEVVGKGYICREIKLLLQKTNHE